MATIQELMNEISNLQKTEEQLYQVLTRNAENIALGKNSAMTDNEINSITSQINSLTASRVNLYNALSKYYQEDVVLEKSVKKTINQQTETLKILERELNKSKQNLAKLEDDKYNQLKMIEINSYFSKQYNAHVKLMRLVTIVGLCMLCTLLLNYIEPLKVASKPLFNIVLIIGAFLIIKVTIDMYLRRNDNYDEFKWGLTPTTSIDSSSNQTTTTTSSECAQAPKPFGENQTGCYGASCCSVGTVWDETTYTCVNKPVSSPN
jgi:hypothetical protein